jgi:hypothetical protein
MHHLIWYGKLAKAHIKEANKIHPNTRNNKAKILNQTTFINSWKQANIPIMDSYNIFILKDLFC